MTHPHVPLHEESFLANIVMSHTHDECTLSTVFSAG